MVKLRMAAYIGETRWVIKKIKKYDISLLILLD